MSAILDQSRLKAEREEKLYRTSELMPIFIDTENSREPDAEETSHIVVVLDEYSRVVEPEVEETTLVGHHNVCDPIEYDLEDADFYLKRNLPAEARFILNKLAIHMPDDPLLNTKLAELSLLENQHREKQDTPNSAPIPLIAVDISSKIRSGIGPLELEKIVDELFKTEIDSAKNRKESSNPGEFVLAPAEGMKKTIDEPVNQLMEAVSSSEHEVLCYIIVGRQYLKRERAVSAIRCFKKGLHLGGLTEHDKIALYFELGQTYERINFPEEAVYYYKKVERFNSRYRDVANRLKLLR